MFLLRHASFFAIIEPCLEYPHAQEIEKQMLGMDPAHLALIAEVELIVMNDGSAPTVNGLFTIARLFHSVPALRPYPKDAMSWAASQISAADFARRAVAIKPTHWEADWHPGSRLHPYEWMEVQALQTWLLVDPANYRPQNGGPPMAQYVRAPIKLKCIVKGRWPSDAPDSWRQTAFWAACLKELRRWGERAAVTGAGWVVWPEALRRLLSQSESEHRKSEGRWRCNYALHGLCVPGKVPFPRQPPVLTNIGHGISQAEFDQLEVIHYD